MITHFEGKLKLATLDFETDPFLHGRVPEPFCCGLYEGDDYNEFWGDDCTEQLIDYLSNREQPLLIFAHNGGKFDFYFLLYKEVVQNPVKIINGRVAKAACMHHELRDSFSILPVPLAAYQKDEIDYTWFEREEREDHKEDILHYLASDCEYLYELVHNFLIEFGLNLTIGGTAIKRLRELHPFEQISQSLDESIRPYYYGGRVQSFEKGLKRGDFTVIDVNSMYPFVMAAYAHCCGSTYDTYYDVENYAEVCELADDMPYFITFDGMNNGALPMRVDDSLQFNVEEGTFGCTSHELKVAVKYGLVTVEHVHELMVATETINFKEFVDFYIAAKVEAKRTGNKTMELFAKLLLNSSYGKTGQNPENFKDYYIKYPDYPVPDLDEYDLAYDTPYISIFDKPAPRPIYYDVGIAASVTGASRAVLLDGLMRVKRPIYCDTDSIICENHGDLDLDPYRLGAWDIEAQGDTIALAGKKLYCLWNGKESVKLASKGAKLTPDDLLQLASGKNVHWESDAPNFKLSGDVKFISRTLQKR